jgi:hypothetical protein
VGPQPRRIEPKFALLGAGVVAMILYGSLFLFPSIFAGVFRGIVLLIAVLFALHVCINALRPFQFLSQPRPFRWTPFLSFLMASRESAVRAFFEKAFMYGTLVWLLVRAGWKIGRATLATAAMVLALRLAQAYLPGRSAEITDTIMVLGLAGVLRLVEKV